MIESILPATVSSVEHVGPDDATLQVHPLEEALVARAVEKRRREFITARHVARQALAGLGCRSDVPIRKDDKGAPVWPKGFVGAITHCQGYRAAAVAHKLTHRSIGIDAEPDLPLPAGVYGTISLPVEREEAAGLEAVSHVDRVLFCAKEATYKAWFPITGRWLGFEDAHIQLRPDGSFTSTILIDGTPSDKGEYIKQFSGRYRVGDGYILTAIVA